MYERVNFFIAHSEFCLHSSRWRERGVDGALPEYPISHTRSLHFMGGCVIRENVLLSGGLRNIPSFLRLYNTRISKDIVNFATIDYVPIML